MLDEKDLQSISQIMDSKIKESEQRMSAKIEASEQRTAQLIDSKISASEERVNAKIEEAASKTLKEAMQGASAMMEAYFEPKFNLLSKISRPCSRRSRRRAGWMSWRKRLRSCARSSVSTAARLKN